MLLLVTIIVLMVIGFLQLNRKRNLSPRSNHNAADITTHPNPLYHNNQSMYVLYSLVGEGECGGSVGVLFDSCTPL